MPSNSQQPSPAHPSARSPRRRSGFLGRHGRRFLAAGLIAVAIAVVVALVPGRLFAAGSFVGVKSYYLGLGDSLAFGYQPNLDWTHGYVYQWYPDLQKHGATSRTDYGCNGEKSSTFINGGCPYAYALHNYYLGSQLNAAVNFIKNHPGQVSPVSLDMGANDVLPDINSSTCVVASTWESDLATMNTNLSTIILPRLINALKNSSGQLTGDLVMMNYYNPFANKCPNDGAYTTELNNALASDWAAGWKNAGFSAPPYGLADVYGAFATGGDGIQNDCTYTWMCSVYTDIHATGGQSGEPGNGYGVIANAFKTLTGY